MKIKFLLLKMLCLLGIISCSESATGQNKLDANAFEKLIKSTPDLQLVDVRTPQEYANGHLSDCKNINFNDADFKAKMEKLDKSKPVAVYCAAGGRSGKAAAILNQMGFKTVYDLAGGITAWNSGGKATVK